MNTVDIFTALFGMGFIGTAIGWIVERKKRNAETPTIDIENRGKQIQQYKDMLDDLPMRYEKKFKEFEELYNRKIQLLEDEIAVQKRVIASLKAENSELRKKIKGYADNSIT